MNKERHEPAIRRFWQSFLNSLPPGSAHFPTDYQAWKFGNTPEMADELGELVLRGRKTATASLVWMYEAENEQYPEVGDFHIILDGREQPICIIQTTELEVKAFNEVGEEHAYLEGEGDRSLKSWREVHWKFFSEECSNIGRVPDLKMPVFCERFSLVFAEEH